MRVAGDEAQWTKRKEKEERRSDVSHLSSCILGELHTHKKATFGVKKIYFQFFYLPSILHIQINQMSLSLKVRKPKFLAKQRQWEDDQVPEQQKKKGKGKKESGRERSI